MNLKLIHLTFDYWKLYWHHKFIFKTNLHFVCKETMSTIIGFHDKRDNECLWKLFIASLKIYFFLIWTISSRTPSNMLYQSIKQILTWSLHSHKLVVKQPTKYECLKVTPLRCLPGDDIWSHLGDVHGSCSKE